MFENKQILEQCKQNFLSVVSVLNRMKKNYWITDGTLLGFIREQNFILHDKDFDIGLRIEELDRALVNELYKQGFEIIWLWGTLDRGYQISFIRERVPFDMFLFYEDREAEEMFHSAHFSYGGEFIYKYKTFTVKQATWFETPINIPSDPHLYVVQKYGLGWAIPTKRWNSKTDPYNLDWQRMGYSSREEAISEKKKLERTNKFPFRTKKEAYDEVISILP